MESLRQHIFHNGMESVEHGGKGRNVSHAITEDQKVNVTTFILHKEDSYNLAAPASTKNATFARVFLPVATIKLHLWREYRKVCESTGKTPVGESSFRNI